MALTSSRIESLRSAFIKLGIDAFLITFQPHLRYMSNFSGSNGIGLITRRDAYLFSDGRYTQQIAQEVSGWKVIITKENLFDELTAHKLLRAGTRVGFDGNTLLLAQYRDLKRLLPKVKFLPKVDTIDRLAAVKDSEEIGSLQKAIDITDTVFHELLGIITPGMTELDIAAEISYRQRKYLAEGDAFEPIVASGVRGALPHGRATAKKIRKGELLTLDFGCIYKGYHSDMTRTIAIGKPSADAKKMYTVVLDAQERAIAAAHAGFPARDLDAVARGHITHRGYGKYFQHSLGHGVGLQIHEQPKISRQNKAALEIGNVITIEPGVYVPGFGGVRIEDIVVIRNGTCAILTRSPKHLIIL